MTKVCIYIPGLKHALVLAHDTNTIPSIGDRIYVYAEFLDDYSRRELEETPAFHCVERNEMTEHMSIAEFLKESVITVTGKGWSYGNGTTYCSLEVDVEY